VDADKEQIAEVLIRYATGIDSKDWPLFRSCWADEIDVDYQQLGRYTSADALTKVMTSLHENMGPTYHRLSNSSFTSTGTAQPPARMSRPC
jgi:hypothetical protein